MIVYSYIIIEKPFKWVTLWKGIHTSKEVIKQCHHEWHRISIRTKLSKEYRAAQIFIIRSCLLHDLSHSLLFPKERLRSRSETLLK